MWVQALNRKSSDDEDSKKKTKLKKRGSTSQKEEPISEYSSTSAESSESELESTESETSEQISLEQDSDEKSEYEEEEEGSQLEETSEEEEDEYDEDEDDTLVIQNIIGEQDQFKIPSDSGTETTEDESIENNKDKKYYVKFQDKSYIHCKWLTQSEIYEIEGGEAAFHRYVKKTKSTELEHSESINSLLTYDNEMVNSDWYQIDRIINDANEKGAQEYLVKWKGMEYADSTWEKESDIEDKSKIEEYRKRLSSSNPKKIPTRWKRPSAKEFKELKEPYESKTGQVLRDYQLEGLNWLRFCWFHKTNSILADEMGLGKTVQIVTMLKHLKEEYKINGPFLIAAPLSTLPHWKMEFERWSDFNVVVFHGNQESRKTIIETEFQVFDENGRIVPSRVQFDVIITNYESLRTEYSVFSSIEWRYLVADEGHKLKNYKGKLYKLMSNLKCEQITLLTGTPIQNDMSELWALLHFLHPERFDDLESFMEKYGNMTDSKQVGSVQKIIKKIILRRKKSDVEKAILPKEETIIEVELTRIQKKLYRAYLHENASSLLQQITGSAQLPSLQNLVMELRKVCNHPFLIRDAEKGIIRDLKESNPHLAELPKTELQERALIEASGKMILIDKLLPKLKEDGHKVLIFSQMVRVLNIIESYLYFKGYSYERIDGSISEAQRNTSIQRYNNDPDRFVFLLSTKAGGVGINLTAADTVIIYDSDWNPQNDIQAQARCHRIGQKATVKVYRLITKGTYENEMFQRASLKLGLDHVVLDGGEMNKNDPMKASEIEKMLRHGAYDIFNDDDSAIDNFCSADIDQILENRAKNYKEDVVSGGGSIFSKAGFNPENDDLDVNATDFWSHILPTSKKSSSNDDIFVRRCRKEKELQQLNEGIDTPNHARKTIQNMIDRGYTDPSNERNILRIAFSLYRVEDPVSNALIRQLIRGNDEEADIVIEDPMKEFGELTLIVEERAAKLLTRTAYFGRLRRGLFWAQGDEVKWPVLKEVWEDPVAEYSLMVGLERYGWREIAQIIDDPDLGLASAKPLSPNAIEKRVFSLVESLETQYPFDFKYPIDFEPAKPEDWKKSHPQLLARDFLADHELLSVFQTICSIGIPIKMDQSTDWAKIKEHAKIQLVQTEAIKRYGEKLVEFAQSINFDELKDLEEIQDKEKEPEKEIEKKKKEKKRGRKPERDKNIKEEEVQPPSKHLDVDMSAYPELQPLQNLINLKEMKKITTVIREMGLIYEFINTLTPHKIELMEGIPEKQQQLPTWWNLECDRYLIEGIAKYGETMVSWLIKPESPFRSHFNPEGADKVADKMIHDEEVKGRPARPPKDIGDLMFVFRERSRVSRAIRVIECVNKRMSKGKKKKKSPAHDPHNDIECALQLSHHFRILSFGTITNASISSKTVIFPIGYIAERKFPSTRISQKQMYWYKMEIVEKENRPFFVITNEETNDVYADFSSTNAWKMVYEAHEIDMKHFNKSGNMLFGLRDPLVMEELNKMKIACSFANVQVARKDVHPFDRIINFNIEIPVYNREFFT